MHIPTDQFLNGFTRDVLTILGGLGVLLTGVGVWIAVLQMRRTTSSAQAATDAALKTLSQTKSRFNRYVASLSHKLLSEAGVHVRNRSFDAAALRLQDLGEILTQIIDDDAEWPSFVERVFTMQAYFEKIHAEDRGLSDNQKSKWNKLERELRTKIGKNISLFG